MQLNNILMVDDDLEDMQIIKDAFHEIESDAQMSFAENGQQAIDMLQQASGALPCLIVLDLNMPRMNGRQTLSFLKSHDQFKHITVIIYSTSVNEHEKQACLELGAAEYVIKPVTYKSAIEIAHKFSSLCNIG
jgi:CheY-like chemotaxis protein